MFLSFNFAALLPFFKSVECLQHYSKKVRGQVRKERGRGGEGRGDGEGETENVEQNPLHSVSKETYQA